MAAGSDAVLDFLPLHSLLFNEQPRTSAKNDAKMEITIYNRKILKIQNNLDCLIWKWRVRLVEKIQKRAAVRPSV